MGRVMGRMAATAALLWLGVSTAHAGSWFTKGQPVPAWGMDAAKTHVPDYVKDASAVILFDEYVETVDNAGRAVEREREAIRILKPQGRGNTCEVSHDVDEKVNYFRVWTMTADEKTYQAQDTDFVEQGDTDIPVMLSTRKRRIAHPPAVDVGATIICESEEQMEPYLQEKVWSFQSGIPVVFQALEVDLPPGRRPADAWHIHAPMAPVEVAPNHWRWELKDEQALDLRDIPSTPDWAALLERMTVQWGDAAVPGQDAEWRALGAWFTQLEQDRPQPTPEITARVQQLTAGAPDFYTKLKVITEAIQKEVRYFIVMRGVGGLQANHAGDIYRNRYGDCKDKTTLLIAMLQVAGIHAYYVPVDHRRGVVDPADPSLVGDHMITAIEIPAEVTDARLRAVTKAADGKRYLIFDPTDENTPVGNLGSYLQGSYGLLSAGSASQVIELPVLAPDANGTVQKGAFTLAEDGTISGDMDTEHAGPEGSEFRQFLKETDDRERLADWEKYVARTVPGVQLNGFKFVQPPSLDTPMEFHYKLSAGEYAHHAGPLLLVRPRVVGTLALPFNDKPRTLPIDLNATGRWHDSFEIKVPADYVVDETPDPVDVDLSFASYHSTVTAKGDTIHYEREYVVRSVEIPADKAGEFRKLESAILTDEKGNAVLRKK